jgi:hypothetical protein
VDASGIAPLRVTTIATQVHFCIVTVSASLELSRSAAASIAASASSARCLAAGWVDAKSRLTHSGARLTTAAITASCSSVILAVSLFTLDPMTHRIGMPIRPENRWLYPIDWEQLSATVRFKRRIKV